MKITCVIFEYLTLKKINYVYKTEKETSCNRAKEGDGCKITKHNAGTDSLQHVMGCVNRRSCITDVLKTLCLVTICVDKAYESSVMNCIVFRETNFRYKYICLRDYSQLLIGVVWVDKWM